MMDRMERARQLRRAVGFGSAALPDEQAAQVLSLFPAWEAAGTYQAGDRVQHEDRLYKCLQAHAAQKDWTPEKAPSLWVRIDDPAEEWPAWRQPSGSEEAYPKGAKVSHSGKRWVSDLDGNVWEPGEYGWTEAV